MLHELTGLSPELCVLLAGAFVGVFAFSAYAVYSFGRRDQLDVAALKRLVNSLSRFISPEDMQDIEAQSAGLKFISSRPAGGALLLKGLWH